MHFFYIESKRFLQSIWIILAGAVALFIMIGAIAFCTYSYLSDGDEVSSVGIGVVTGSEEEDFYSLLIVNSFEAGKDYYNFVIYDTEEAGLAALEDGKILGLIVAPDDLMEAVMYGDEVHAKIYYSTISSSYGILLREFAESGARVLQAAQAEVYAVYDVYTDLSALGITPGMKRSEIIDMIDVTNLRYAFQMDELYDVSTITAQNNIDYQSFYTTAAVVAILAFLGLFFSAFLVYPNQAFISKVRVCRHWRLKDLACRFTFVFGFYLVFEFLLLPLFHVFLQKGSLSKLLGSAGFYAGLVGSALFFSLTILLLFETIHATGPAIFSYLLVILVLMTLSGFIIPYAFMGRGLRILYPYMPYHIIQEYIRLL